MRNNSPIPKAGLHLLVITWFTWMSTTAAIALECEPLVRADSVEFEIRFGDGLLFELTSPEGRKSTIVGTMHVSDPQVTAMLELARSRLESADQFVMEVVFDNNTMQLMQTAMFYHDERSLRDLVGEDLFEQTVKRLDQYKVTESIAARMKPWAAFTTLSFPAADNAAPLDLILMGAAQQAGIPVHGLETAAEQIGIFETMGEDLQLDLLRDSVCHYEVFQTDLKTMMRSYAQGDLRALVQASLKYDAPHREDFLEILLWQRNRTMLSRLQPMLKKSSVFVAVGALHLVGPQGLLQQLEQLGYQVRKLH